MAGLESLCRSMLTLSGMSFFSPKISETSVIKLTTALVKKAFKEICFNETYNLNLTKDEVTDLLMQACNYKPTFST